MKKGKKQLVHRIVFGVLAALFLVFNVAIYVAFDYLTKVTNIMGLKLDSVEAESVRAEATEFTKEITREGMVLLRNKDNALPLPAGSAINLFGWSSTQMIIGGNGGSGGVSSASVNIKSSLEAAGFSVNEDLYSMYQSYKGRPGHRARGKVWRLLPLLGYAGARHQRQRILHSGAAGRRQALF